MKKHASALALAALLAVPAAHAQDVAVDFNGEFELNGYNINDDRLNDDIRATQQLLRLGANVKLGRGVQVVTRMNLANDTWKGDTRSTNVSNVIDPSPTPANPAGLPISGSWSHGGPFSPDAGDNVTLDLGYVQLPLGPGLLRAGRMTSDWANCFVSCDDRRDRIIWMTQLGPVGAGFFYDKRAERLVGGFGPADAGLETEDDTWAVAAAFTGKVGGADAGLLIYHNVNDKDAAAQLPADLATTVSSPFLPLPGADGSVTLISPYFSTDVAGLELSGAVAYQVLDYDDFTTGGGVTIEFDDQWGGYLRAGYDAGVVKVELQGIYSDKYTVNQGFDTFSSLLNNSPENNQSPTSVTNLTPRAPNAVSTVLADEAWLGSVRVSGNVTNQVKLVAAAGIGTSEYTTYNLLQGAAVAGELDLQFYDLQVHYQVNPSTLIWATAGRLTQEPAAGSDIDTDAISLNLRTQF